MDTEEKEVKDIDVKKLEKLFSTLRGNLKSKGISAEETTALGALLLICEMLEEGLEVADIYTEAVEMVGNALSLMLPEDREGF